MVTHAQLAIIARSIRRDCPDTYAKSYAHVLFEMIEQGHPEDHIRTQALYVRAHLAHWRGQTARIARATLDKYLNAPESPLTLVEAIAALRLAQASDDTEVAHREADDILCAFLEAKGYVDLVREYHKVRKWFA